MTHTYIDNFIGYFGDKPLQIAVYDRQTRPGSPNDDSEGAGQDVEFLALQVNNVAPAFVGSSVTVKKKGKRQVVVEGDFVDPGTNDVMQVDATWSDPTSPAPKSCTLSKGNRRFLCEHTFGPPDPAGTDNIVLKVHDDEGGRGLHTTSVQIQ